MHQIAFIKSHCKYQISTLSTVLNVKDISQQSDNYRLIIIYLNNYPKYNPNIHSSSTLYQAYSSQQR